MTSQGSIADNEDYELIAQALGSIGMPKQRLGSKGGCRYCRNPGANFCKDAHLVPEALGNKTLFSLDECDDCNARFSLYEAALADAVSPFLTFGGVRGKRGVRSTGRSAGASQVRHSRDVAGKRQLSVRARCEGIGDPPVRVRQDGVLVTEINLPPVPFRPRFAYKALAKVGYALLPVDEISHFERLRHWLLEVNDLESFTFLEVGFSHASVGNSPPIVSVQLIRRRDTQGPGPYMILALMVGSVGLQIEMMSDNMEDHCPPAQMGVLQYRGKVVIASPGDGSTLTLDYGTPRPLDWSSRTLRPQPVEKMTQYFDPRTCQAKLVPIFRSTDCDGDVSG